MPARTFTPAPDRHGKQTRFLAELARGAPPPQAAERAGAPLCSFYTWRQRNKSFRAAWKKARDQARAMHYELPPRQRQVAEAAAARGAEPKRLHVVVRSFVPGIPNRHILMETWPDGRRTSKEWDEPPSRAELLEVGEDPDAWEAARDAANQGKDPAA